MDRSGGWDGGEQHRLDGWRRGGIVVVLIALAAAAATLSNDRRDATIAIEEATPTSNTETPRPSQGPADWPALTQPTNVVLYLAAAPSTVLVFDVDRRRVVAKIPMAPPLGDYPVVAYVAGRLIVHATDDRIYALDSKFRQQQLGRSPLFLPVHPNRVVLVTGGSDGEGDMRVRVVDVSGRRIVRSTPVPSGMIPVGGQRDQVMLDGDDGLHWWDPRTGRMRRVGALVALDVGETAAVVCPNSCHTVDLVDGSRATRLGGDVARPVSAAALSPDETHVALLEDRESTFTLLVSDVATGAVRPIATGLRRATAAGTVAWSRDGRFLFFQTGGGNLGVFDAELGTTHLVEVDVDLGLADFMVAGDAQMADTAPQTEQPSTNGRRPDVR